MLFKMVGASHGCLSMASPNWDNAVSVNTGDFIQRLKVYVLHLTDCILKWYIDIYNTKICPEMYY